MDEGNTLRDRGGVGPTEGVRRRQAFVAGVVAVSEPEWRSEFAWCEVFLKERAR